MLNACFSDDLAEALLPHVRGVIGMRATILDTAARAFSAEFYWSLELSVRRALEVSKSAIALAVLAEADQPVLRTERRAGRTRRARGRGGALLVLPPRDLSRRGRRVAEGAE